jgi:hypothetical protein
MGTLPILAQFGPQEKHLWSISRAPCRVNLQGVDGFGEVARAPGSKQSFRRIRQVLSWAFASSPEARSFACSQHDQVGGLQFVEDAPDPPR